MVTKISLLPPGVVSKPLFKSKKAYQKFRDSFSAAVIPQLKKHARARALSEHESFTRGPFRQ